MNRGEEKIDALNSRDFRGRLGFHWLKLRLHALDRALRCPRKGASSSVYAAVTILRTERRLIAGSIRAR